MAYPPPPVAKYLYHAHGVTLLIEQIGKGWAIGQRSKSGPPGTDFSAEYRSAGEAADAVGKQRSGFDDWDKLPDVPLDCGRIENWIRRQT